MNITLGKLKKGEYRHFTETELNEINRLVANSSKTSEALED
jgi:23S rRNA pseudouridine2604 synthase